MASLTARKTNENASICILESMDDIGKKLRICGGSRCNFTNNADINSFFDKIVSNEKFLYSALYTFTNEDMKKFVKSLGIDYIVESENEEKVYLKSGNSMELINRLRKEIIDLRIQIYFNNKVNSIDRENNIVYTKSNTYKYKKLIIASGGMSYPNTGSDGSILNILNKQNYEIKNFKPALCRIDTNIDEFKEIVGTSIDNVNIEIENNILSGGLIFTHRGLGGPAILKASSYLQKYNKKSIEIDFLPDVDKDELYKLVKEKSKSNIYNNMKNILPAKFSKSIIKIANKKSKIESSKFDFENGQVANLSKKDFDIIYKYLKKFEIEDIGFAPIEYATISQGGVDVRQIESSTMNSKIDKDIYICGEILDIDAITGGFNLQIAFSTGYLAGLSAAQAIDNI